MELYGKALFCCKNIALLEILDEFLKVTVFENINEISIKEADFLFIDPSIESQEKIIYFCKHYINNNITIFYCCSLEELDNIKVPFDDYISLPFSRLQVKYKLKFWSNKKVKQLNPQNDEMYILEKIDFHLNHALALTDNPALLFHISSIEWLLKFITIQSNEINEIFIEEIFNFVRFFLKNFNSRVRLKIFFSFQSINLYHQRNLLQVILCLTRVCCIYRKSIIRVKKIEENIYIFLDKKPNLYKDYMSCILLKKITDRFRKNWQIQKLENGTLFKYTLFED